MELIFIYILSLVLGLTVGSFLNVVIFRTEKDQKITGRSFCPKCKKQILWYDNIPLLSFLLLGGRCRFCHKKISAQYPFVEGLTGLTFLLVTYLVFSNILNGWLGHYFSIAGIASLYQYYGLEISLQTLGFFLKLWELIFLWGIFSVFIMIFVYDRKHMLIPDVFTWIGIIIAALYALITDVFIALSVFLSSNQNLILETAALEKKQALLGNFPLNISSFFALNKENFFSIIIHLKSNFPDQFIYSFIFSSHLGSGLVAGLSAALAFFLLVYFSKETWMGMGDVKLVFFLGLFLGIFKTIVALFIGFEIGALLGIYLMLSGRAKMKTALPFGPFLIIGAALSLLFV